MSDVSWLVFVVVYLLTDSFRMFLDNYVSDFYFKGRGSASQKLIHGSIQVLFALIVLPFAGLSLANADWPALLTFFASGAVISIAGIPYFRALELDDSTNLAIFMQLSPIFYLILGWLIFHDSISPHQLVAFAIILAAPILILRMTSKRSQKTKLRAVLFTVVYVLISVVANLVFAKQSISSAESVSFLAQISLFFLGKGLSSILIISPNKKWRNRLRYVIRRNPRKVPRLLISGTLIGFVADAAYRMALASAPIVAIASAATDSVEPVVIFFMGIVLTLINPKFGREQLNKKTIMTHLAATGLVAVGVALIQF